MNREPVFVIIRTMVTTWWFVMVIFLIGFYPAISAVMWVLRALLTFYYAISGNAPDSFVPVI
jgi:hypothetical protein